MGNQNLDFFLNEQVQINLITFVEGLVLAAFLSFLIQITYIKFSNSLSNRYNFSKNFIILGLATALVITIVKSSLALSLGLVGALSIVRFRPAIKEPEELVYLFLVIATGLGCGAGQPKITSIGIIASLIIIIILNLIWRKSRLGGDEIINSTIIFNKKILDKKEIDHIIKKIESNCIEVRFISLASTDKETNISLDIKPKNFDSLNKILTEIKKEDGEAKIMFAKSSMISL